MASFPRIARMNGLLIYIEAEEEPRKEWSHNIKGANLEVVEKLCPKNKDLSVDLKNDGLMIICDIWNIIC